MYRIRCWNVQLFPPLGFILEIARHSPQGTPMPVQRRIAFLLASLVLPLACFTAFAFNKNREKNRSDPAQMPDSRRAQHALQRLTFGPRPGDLERVAAMGVDKWIDLQLHPEKIDDSAVEGRLSGFPTLRMGTREIVE